MDSEWFLEKRESGCLVWCRKAAKVKFRCEVDILEFWPGEYEKKWEPCCWDRAEPKMETSNFAAALCLAIIAMIVGFKVYC